MDNVYYKGTIYTTILSGKYTIDTDGRVYNSFSGKEIHTRRNKKTGRKEIRLYDLRKDPKGERTRTFSHARLLYYAFHPSLDYEDKNWQVRVKDDKRNYNLNDLYLVQKEDENGTI